MIKTLYGSNGIKYQVIKDGIITTYEDIDDAIRDEFHIGSTAPEGWYSIHYDIMDREDDLEFLGRKLRACEPRFCNGDWVMWEYNTLDDGVAWIITNMDKRVYAMFALREQAMKYIYDKE